jgi:integrating conjugative element relaxase (TIGR03760 family)
MPMMQFGFAEGLTGAGAIALVGALAMVLRLTSAPKKLRTSNIGVDGAKLEFANVKRLPVLTSSQLLEQLNLKPLLATLEQRSGLSHESFARDVRVVIDAVAELVQLLPASESHHHAHPGGLLTHLLECANHALALRQGVIMPKGALPEEIGMNQHRWTYAVLIAALLHDIGKPLTDLTITAYRADRTWIWAPITGSLVQTKASEYLVAFNANRTYADHQSLSIQLLQRFVPSGALSWINEIPLVLAALTSYLSCAADDNHPFASLIERADGESVRHNLAHGSRTRFASAAREPLIETIMWALRQMLDESRLPLNRAGAVGWVYQGEIWFVSKRLVDEIRAYLVETKRNEGFPSADRNDRVFDCLQDYGAVIRNPMNQKAIWNARVELGGDGTNPWSSDLTLLRFSLGKLYSDPARFPPAINGSIRLSTVEVVEQAIRQSIVEPILQTAEHTEPLSDDQLANQNSFAAKQAQSAADNYSLPNLELDLEGNQGSRFFTSTSQTVEPIPLTENQTQEQPENSALSPALIRSLPPVVGRSIGKVSSSVSNSELPQTASKPARPESLAKRTVLPPVVPALPKIAVLKPKKVVEVPDEAQAFMRWIQEGVASGDLPVNTRSSVVHFATIEHESLSNLGQQEPFMLFVSPFVFHQYAQAFSLDAMDVQRKAFKAGWHLSINPGNINILRFNITGSNKTKQQSLLNCMAIRNPERFINPLPHANPVLSFNYSLTAPMTKAVPPAAPLKQRKDAA